MSVFKCSVKFTKVPGNSEKSAKNKMVASGIIDKFYNIPNLGKFREANTEISKGASTYLGRQVRLYDESMDHKTAIPNKAVFTDLDTKKRMESIKFDGKKDYTLDNSGDNLQSNENAEDLKVQKEIDTIVEDTNKIEEKTDTYFSITPEVNYNLKASEILSSQRADEIFRKGDKNNWSVDKILTELQVPQEQKQLLLSFNTRNREELLTNLLANYSYTVEINTAKGLSDSGLGLNDYDENGKIKPESEIRQKAKPTDFYSNLTVPGGTNYTENEIATPAITPSIKGHAQFSTDNGIGWFRSDEQINTITNTDKIIWGHPAIGKTTLLEKNPNLFIDWDVEFNRKRDTWIASKSNTIIGTSEFKKARNEYMINYNKHKDYVAFVKEEWSRVKEKAGNENKVLIASPHMLLNLFPNDFDKVITMNDKTFMERAVKRSNGDEVNSRLWKEGINETLKAVNKNKIIDTDKYISDLFPTKTLRILEVQSDLFQKGRDKSLLISEAIGKPGRNAGGQIENEEEFLNGGYYYYTYTGSHEDGSYKEEYSKLSFNDRLDRNWDNKIKISKEEYEKVKKEYETTGYYTKDSKNQFLQLLNKDNNWVTFFIKSIIQDSAKKGYEKVLFPTGNTAAKVEGHQTLEEYKRVKEERIKDLEKELLDSKDKIVYYVEDAFGIKKFDWSFDSRKDAEDANKNDKNFFVQETKLQPSKDIEREIEQIKQELERVDREGFASLNKVADFYETSVTNILKKQGYNPAKVTDEHGNTWNKVEIKSEFKNQISLNLSQKSAELKALPDNKWFNKTIQPIINRFSKMFPNVRSVVISEKEIPSEVKSIVDALDKQINSFFHKGQVYIIKERVTKDITIEEFLHPFINALENDNPELFKSLLLEAKKLFPELKDKIFTDYKGVYNSIFDLNREFLTQALTQKVSEQTPEQETFFQKFKTWIRNILDKLFGNETTTREISMLDETMSLTDLASILTENNTQFNFNPDTNTTYFSLSGEEIDSILSNLDAIDATNTQRLLTSKILENNKVTETDFSAGKHEYTRNELGEIVQLMPVSNFLGKVKLDQTYEGYIELGNFVHDLAKSITSNTTEDFQSIVDKSLLRTYLMDEKGYPKETVDAFAQAIFNYINFLKQKGSVLISEVSISTLQEGLPNDFKGIGGTIDLIEITTDGKIIIHDFKSTYLDYKSIFANNPKDILNTKFNYRKDGYSKQLSLYAKLLKGLVGNKISIELQIMPIGYVASNVTNENGAITFTAPLNNKGEVDLFSDARGISNLIYSPIGRGLMDVDKKSFQVPYNKSFADKTIPSIEDKEEKKLSKEEIDRQELLQNLTNKIKSANSKALEIEIEKVFKQVTTIVTQYGNSQNELNKELFKLFDPKGELKETKSNFEAIFEAIKEMDSTDPERLKHYLSTLVQYINYIEETNVGLSNIKNHFYKIVANDSNVDNQTLIADMRRSYLLAKSHKERMNSILAQLSDVDENNIFKQMLRKSGSYVDEIESIYFEKSLPLVATVLDSYFSKDFKDSLMKEYQERIDKIKYDLNIAKSDAAKKRLNAQLVDLENKIAILPSSNIISRVIKGEFGDSDWFYSNLMANINNPDYVISGTEAFMIDIMRDLSVIALRKEEEFARQFSKREDTLGVSRDQTKSMNKDLVYASKHLVKKADGTIETQQVMTLLTEVNEDVYFDYEVLQNELKKTLPNTPERKLAADKIKQFELEHFENQFNPAYLQALNAIDTVVSDGRNVKQVRQTILDRIKAIKVKNYKEDYLQGEFQEEEDLTELRELWRQYINLSSPIDRNGNKKTGADLEIANILQDRKKDLEQFRDKKVNEDLWKKLRARKIQSLLSKYNSEEEVLKSEEFRKWQSFNSVIQPNEQFYTLRQEKLDAINGILSKKDYKDIPLAGQLKDNLNQSWEKLLAISREYRDFEREIITDDIPEGTKQSMKLLEENIDKIKGQIKSLEKSLTKEDKKNLNSLWEEYNSMIDYKTSKYYEEDFENALNKYALDNNLELSELKTDGALMTEFRLNSEWYINNHVTKEKYDKISGDTIRYSEPVYYYKVTMPSNPEYLQESPASQYASFELKDEAYNLDDEGNPNYLDVFGRKKVKSTSKYITENIAYLKIKNDMSAKGRVNFENLQFLKAQMEEAQKGLNKQNYLYYRIPADRKSTFERGSEGDVKGIKKNLKELFTINPQDEDQLGTRGVLANLAGEEAKFIPVLGKSKIDFEDQSYNVWKSILNYTMSATKAKMFEEKLPIFDVLIDQLEKNLPAVDGNKTEAIGDSMSNKFNLENVKEVIKGRGDKRVQAVKDTVARYVYEEFTKELANIGGVSDIKLTNTLLGYAGATMMVGNVPNWIVNAMSGNIQLLIEAAGKRYFSGKDLAQAKVELAARHKDTIKDYSKTHDKSLFGQLVEYFDPVKGEFMDNLGNKFTWSTRTDLKKVFFSGKIYGEWEMQMTTFIAMLKAKKVKQVINGVEKVIDLYDAFEKGTDGVPKLKEGVQITDKELRDYMTKIQGVNKLLNGSYAKLDQTKIEKYSLGRMAIFMKKFFIPLFVNRFGGLRGDAELQDVREGHYISFYNAVVKDVFNIPLAEVYAKLKKSPEDGGYTDLQKTAIKKTLVELAFITALTLSLMLLGYDDGKEDTDAKKFAQYIALKLRREVATFTPVAAPQEFASFFSRPFAAMSATGNLINLAGMTLKMPINMATGAFEEDLYYQKKTSMWEKGDSKFLSLLYKSIGLKLNIAHPDQLLQGYNYSIRL